MRTLLCCSDPLAMNCALHAHQADMFLRFCRCARRGNALAKLRAAGPERHCASAATRGDGTKRGRRQWRLDTTWQPTPHTLDADAFALSCTETSALPPNDYRDYGAMPPASPTKSHDECQLWKRVDHHGCLRDNRV